jgi:nicotinamidase-related amidase
MENINSDFITVINSMLLLVNYQGKKLMNIGSGDKEEITNAAIASAKAAGILKVPVILTSSDAKENGEFIRGITDIFPKAEVIQRNSECIDALDDDKVLKQIRKPGREKLIISGLWTSDCFAETAIHAIKEGFDVFGLIDACGDITQERHNYGIHRMLKSGVTPITWMSLASEWMNGWSDPSEGELSEEIFGKYNAMMSYLSKH